MPRTEAPAAGAAGQRALVRELADRLGETAAAPRHQLARVVDVLGEEQARALLAEGFVNLSAGNRIMA